MQIVCQICFSFDGKSQTTELTKKQKGQSATNVLEGFFFSYKDSNDQFNKGLLK